MVNVMLSAGADVNVTSYRAGRTALMIACFKGEMGIAQQLIERGASWDICDRSQRWSLILTVISSCLMDVFGTALSQKFLILPTITAVFEHCLKEICFQSVLSLLVLILKISFC
jgi:ankyrin repeat protein